MLKYRKYSKDFKLQAAKLVTEQGYSYDQAADLAGMSVKTAHKYLQSGQLPSESKVEHA